MAAGLCSRHPTRESGGRGVECNTMTVREIITPTNKILRQKARKVIAFTPELQLLIDDMIETMRSAPGVGLAAPQIAESLRLFVVQLEVDPSVVEEDESEDASEKESIPGLGRLHVMINPEIVRLTGDLITGTEACLSIPGYAGEVERHERILIRYLDRQGQKRKLKTHGWLARVLQHEYDHLDGVLFIDKAEEVWKLEEDEPEEESDPVSI